MKIVKSTGPRILPCGIPLRTSVTSENSVLTLTCCLRLAKNALINYLNVEKFANLFFFSHYRYLKADLDHIPNCLPQNYLSNKYDKQAGMWDNNGWSLTFIAHDLLVDKRILSFASNRHQERVSHCTEVLLTEEKCLMCW